MFTTKQNSVFTLALTLLLGAGNAAFGQIPAGYFTDVTPVLADPQYGDGAPSVTEDGLTMVFTHVGDQPATSPRPGWLGAYDIYMATRTSTDQAFGNVVPLDGVNTTEWELTGSLSPDGQILYYYRRGSTAYGGDDLYQATRNGASSYGDVTDLGSGVNNSRDQRTPAISTNRMRIYYMDKSDLDGQVRLWSASRPDLGSTFGDAHDLGDAINGIPGTGADHRWYPSISTDERFLFFNMAALGSIATEAYVSYRPTTDDPFGTSVNLNAMWPGSEINTPFTEDGWMFISRDWPAPGSKLYFTRTTDQWTADWDIYQATWVLSGDFDADGDVDGDDFLTWQTGFNVDDRGDADGDGDTDGDDFLIWQTQFGSGSGSISVAVPEPASVALAVVALVSLFCIARRR